MKGEAPHTQMILDNLRSDDYYVQRYFLICKRRGVLPSCSDFIRCGELDWSMYRFDRKPITDYLRARFRELNYNGKN